MITTIRFRKNLSAREKFVLNSRFEECPDIKQKTAKQNMIRTNIEKKPKRKDIFSKLNFKLNLGGEDPGKIV